MIRVLIADDHFLVREGLKMTIAAMQNVEVVGEAANGGEVLAAIKTTNAHVLLLDMSMPGISGVELVRRVKSERPSLSILVLSMYGEAQLASTVLQNGASGYVTKGKGRETLLAAIRKVASGDHYIDPDLAEKILFDVRTPTDSVREQLTGRETQILRMLQAGKSATQIAHELSLSPKTVSTHKIRVMQKLHCQNNVELLKYATEAAVEARF